MDERVHVAVGVIYNKNKDSILISKRSDQQHLAGLWEFPGGKVEDSEDVQVALKRELFEELGLKIKSTEYLTKIQYDYPDKRVLLDVWSVFDWDGEVTGREAQEIRWEPINSLNQYSFPEANKYILNKILLSPLYLISQDTYKDEDSLFPILEQCLNSGLKLFQLRLKDKSNIKFKDLADHIKQMTEQYNAKLIVNAQVDDIDKLNVDGVHLNSTEIYRYTKRPVNDQFILGASCHNEDELQQAEKLSADYVFISPVCKTNSYPYKQPIGWNRFYELCKTTNIPVYALGGMSLDDMGLSKKHGAHGVAMISGIWNSTAPDREINTVLNIL